MTTQPLLCPEGGSSDRIQKVSSVYSEGTAYSTETSSVSSTVLATRLAPPIRPKLRDFTGWYIAVTFCTIALFFAPVPPRAKIWYAGFLALSPLLILLLTVSAFTFGGLRASGNEATVTTFAVTLTAVWAVGYLVINYRVLAKAQRRQKLEYMMIAYPDWCRKREKWENLYYCYTHDCVFDPGTRVYASPEQITTLLE